MNTKIEIDDWLIQREWPDNYDTLTVPYKNKFLQVKIVDKPFNETNN